MSDTMDLYNNWFMVLKVVAFKTTFLSQVSGGNIVQILYIQNLLAVSWIPTSFSEQFFKIAFLLYRKDALGKKLPNHWNKIWIYHYLWQRQQWVQKNQKPGYCFQEKSSKIFKIIFNRGDADKKLSNLIVKKQFS